MDGARLKHQMVVSPTDSKARYPDDAPVKFCGLGYDLELKFNANLMQAQSLLSDCIDSFELH